MTPQEREELESLKRRVEKLESCKHEYERIGGLPHKGPQVYFNGTNAYIRCAKCGKRKAV